METAKAEAVRRRGGDMHWTANLYQDPVNGEYYAYGRRQGSPNEDAVVIESIEVL